MNKTWFAAVVACASIGSMIPTLANAADTSIYQVSEINILPGAMKKGDSVRDIYRELIASLKKQPGLLQIEVTQQLGEPYNFTLIERWQDKASLDAASKADANRDFEHKLEPLLSGPVYQRVFKAFE